MIISLIAAMSENRAIGKDNQLLWHLPEDLKNFRRITSGHPVIMGRKTYESIGRLLPGRENLILTRQAGFAVPGARIAGSLEEAFRVCREQSLPGNDEVFVLGGGEIYRQAMPYADRIHLTLVHRNFEGDTFFPEWDPGKFRTVSREDHEGPLPFSFLLLEKN